jgi:hypothetical protein
MLSLQRTIAGFAHICVNAAGRSQPSTSPTAGRAVGFAIRLPNRHGTETPAHLRNDRSTGHPARGYVRGYTAAMSFAAPSISEQEVRNCRIASDLNRRHCRTFPTDGQAEPTFWACSDREISAETPGYPRNEDQKHERRRGDKLICRFTHSFAKYHDGRSSRRVGVFARPDKGTQYVPVERPRGAAIDGLHFGVVRYNAGHRFKRS